MAQQGVKTAKPNVWQRLTRYFKDVRAEMRRVVWPTRPEIINSSWIVVITLAIFIVLIFVFDEFSTVIIGALARVGG
jgi:preprotein translocase subunit SecE